MYVYFHILYNLALECDLTLWSVMMQSVNRRCERVSNSPPVSRQYRAGTLNSKPVGASLLLEWQLTLAKAGFRFRIRSEPIYIPN